MTTTPKKPAIQSLQETIARNLNSIRIQREFLNTPMSKRLLDMIDHLVVKYGLEEYLDSSSYSTYIYLTAKDLSGLKDEKLAELLDSFVCAEPDDTTTRDQPGSFSRVYVFSWEGKTVDFITPTIAIAVTAQFSEDSETCKRVVVGYREPSKEPTPIYELRCEGDRAPSEN